jgi:cobalamin biosynthesis protein CobD/CbiB
VRPSGPSGAEKISAWLAQRGIERDENESLMATFARALGVTLSELRLYLQRRAAGLRA